MRHGGYRFLYSLVLFWDIILFCRELISLPVPLLSDWLCFVVDESNDVLIQPLVVSCIVRTKGNAVPNRMIINGLDFFLQIYVPASTNNHSATPVRS